MEPYLTEKDVCAYLKVSKRNLFCWRMAGLIPYFKIGRAVRFRKADLDATLGRMRVM
jgi:excisionase family DNA binding protein